MEQQAFPINEYVVFDFETTGLSPWGGDEVIEIGAMRIVKDVPSPQALFHKMVNPRRKIGDDATRIHGITDEMVANADGIEVVFPQFLTFIGHAHLVAQNAKFDMGFVMKYLMQLKVSRTLEVYDTLTLSRRAFPQEARHNLDAIAERLGITYDAAARHRSMADVEITAQAFIRLKRLLQGKIPAREKWTL